MAKKFNIISLFLLLLSSSFSPIEAQALDVTMYGNRLDITTVRNHLNFEEIRSIFSPSYILSFVYDLQGLQQAWKEACASPTPITILIPTGVFNLRVIKLEGPCQSPMTIKLRGIVKAPVDPDEMNSDGWITVNRVDGFTLYGGGTFDGQGKIAWEKNDCHLNTNCAVLPVVSSS